MSLDEIYLFQNFMLLLLHMKCLIKIEILHKIKALQTTAVINKNLPSTDKPPCILMSYTLRFSKQQFPRVISDWENGVGEKTKLLLSACHGPSPWGVHPDVFLVILVLWARSGQGQESLLPWEALRPKQGANVKTIADWSGACCHQQAAAKGAHVPCHC